MKPHNTFVSDAGQFQISDFGCAVKYGDDALISRRGTFIYSTPETAHAKRVKELDASADVYALGVVLYELLNDGYLPFWERNVSRKDKLKRKETVVMRLSGLPFPHPANGNMFLSLAIMKACSFKQKDRYMTADAFLNVLADPRWMLRYQLDPKRIDCPRAV